MLFVVSMRSVCGFEIEVMQLKVAKANLTLFDFQVEVIYGQEFKNLHFHLCTHVHKLCMYTISNLRKQVQKSHLSQLLCGPTLLLGPISKLKDNFWVTCEISQQHTPLFLHAQYKILVIVGARCISKCSNRNYRWKVCPFVVFQLFQFWECIGTYDAILLRKRNRSGSKSVQFIQNKAKCWCSTRTYGYVIHSGMLISAFPNMRLYAQLGT